MTHTHKVILFLLIIAVISAGIGTLLYYQKSSSHQPDIRANADIVDTQPTASDWKTTEDNSQSQIEPEIITSEVDTSDWLTYRNEEWEFEVRYPTDFNLDVTDGIKYNKENIPILSISNGKFPIDFQDTDEVIYELYIDDSATVKEKTDAFVVGKGYSEKLGETNTAKYKTVILGKNFDVVELKTGEPTEGVPTLFKYFYLQYGTSVYNSLLRIPQGLKDTRLVNTFEKIVGSIKFVADR
ncbi:hypothetical protein DCC62_00490 [candidate division KSB1 bacterium]|nr:MAG: hypothetical protein DCC62_00490 [candidate division KSB1 bacterium]